MLFDGIETLDKAISKMMEMVKTLPTRQERVNFIIFCICYLDVKLGMNLDHKKLNELVDMYVKQHEEGVKQC